MCTPSQGGGKLVPACRETQREIHSQRDAVWWRVDCKLARWQRNGNFPWKSDCFPSQLKSAACFHFPMALPCPRHTSLACGVWVDGSSWASSVTFCVLEIFKVIWNKQNGIRLSLCGWRGPLLALRTSPAPGTGLVCSAPLPRRPTPVHQRWHSTWYCWHPPARSDGAKSEGPIYHSHSRKINLHLILNFPLLTFKAIEQIRTPQLFHSTQYFIPGKKQRMKMVFYSPPINWGGGGVRWLRVTKHLLLNLGSCVWKAAVTHDTFRIPYLLNCAHNFKGRIPGYGDLSAPPKNRTIWLCLTTALTPSWDCAELWQKNSLHGTEPQQMSVVFFLAHPNTAFLFCIFSKVFFWCEPFFKVFSEFVTILLLFYAFGWGAWLAKRHVKS